VYLSCVAGVHDTLIAQVSSGDAKFGECEGGIGQRRVSIEIFEEFGEFSSLVEFLVGFPGDDNELGLLCKYCLIKSFNEYLLH
jgi:hypothetical protein